MDDSEWEQFYFDSDVFLAMMGGKTHEKAEKEAKQNLRDEREWRRMSKEDGTN